MLCASAFGVLQLPAGFTRFRVKRIFPVQMDKFLETVHNQPRNSTAILAMATEETLL